MSIADEMHAPLVARRIPREGIVVGRVYVIHARNGGVGVAVEDGGRLGYELHRVKFERHYLFVEWDWDEGPPFGTAIPLRALGDEPPKHEDARLTWLGALEAEHRDEIDEAWAVVLGPSWRGSTDG